MEEGDKLVGLIESPMQCRIYPGVQLVLESFTLSLPQKRIVKLRNICNAISAKQKASRVDRKGLIGLVSFVFGHPPRAEVCDPVDSMVERAHLCECSSC